MKFLLTPPVAPAQLADLRKAYVTGLDRTPTRLSIDFRQEMMICHRDANESGRLFVPWPVAGHGSPIVGTATLAERREPYHLALELARGKLNDVRNQLADWRQMGLRAPEPLDQTLKQAQTAFIKAATREGEANDVAEAAQQSLTATFDAADLLSETYTTQVLQTRLAGAAKLPTQLAGVLEGDPKGQPWTSGFLKAFNAARIPCGWRSLAPNQGQFRWDELDAQLAWCKKNRLPAQLGPLLEFRAGALPDWIWLWEGDFDTIMGLVVEVVRAAVSRYKGKVPLWHLVHRPASADLLGLSEEEQIRIAARAVQVARQADPQAQFTIGVDRPWAEWMGASPFQLGPLHLADYLVRADLGLSGIAIEVAPGFSSPGSHLRDLFDFSRLLDLYALLNMPLHVWIAVPSQSGQDPLADPSIQVEASQWPEQPDPSFQAQWAARWIALAVAKPYVSSVAWTQVTDSAPHVFPHAGLTDAKGQPKPLLGWIQAFRSDLLA